MLKTSDVLILAIAAGAAWFMITKVKAGQGAQVQTAPTMSSEMLGWYLNDIYAKLNAQYA